MAKFLDNSSGENGLTYFWKKILTKMKPVKEKADKAYKLAKAGL